jgi:hypothetical protein
LIFFTELSELLLLLGLSELLRELEIISGNKISDKEKKGRIELLKKISYFYELYEWKGI